MTRDAARLLATLKSLPVGVIVVDEADRVVAWNERAEEFIDCVGRPELFAGMTLGEAHADASRRGMLAMVERLREGRRFPCKSVSGSGREFRVWYNPLMAEDGEYLGVAQVIEFLASEESR